MKSYSLRKCKKILIGVYQLWRRKKKNLLPAQVTEIHHDLQTLQEEILKKNREGANYMAHKCADYADGILKRSSFEQFVHFVWQLILALAVALLIRQMWFELYEIPTGSMRPTFKERDRLVVSKTDFGINFPFSTKHFYFDPDLAKRSGILVFTVANLPVHDPDTMYFWIFPGKKQYVKRLMGLPGDTIYFYGGRLYGIDKEGRDISHELQLPSLSKIDHVPVLRFDGGVSVLEPFRAQGGTGYRTSVIHQMNEPIVRLTSLGANRFEGEMLHAPQIHNRNYPLAENYWELWGIGNYGKAMLKGKDEVRALASKFALSLEDADYFLEILHHPNIKNLTMAKDLYGRLRPQFVLSRSFLPLNETHLKAFFSSMYTARFVIKNGYATRYVPGGRYNLTGRHHFLTRFENVPDGTYEYYHGQAYEIKWQGITKKLDETHPLMRYSPELVYKLFNFGIEFDKRLVLETDSTTGRFAYFRSGNLYLMGSPIFEKGDKTLAAFVTREKELAESANAQNPYIPFIDTGPPVDASGKLDVEKIKQYGLLIPQKSYLALGDNFAMSGDSREFGFVPQGNLRGGPSFIFWPFGKRFGPPNQPPYPWITVPNVVVWLLALLFFVIWYRFHRRHHKLPLKDL